MSDEIYPWLAVRTFNCNEMRISSVLSEHHISHFVPMVRKQVFDDEHDAIPPRVVFVPAIHNYIFIEKTVSDEEIVNVLSDSGYPYLIFKDKKTNQFIEISSEEMRQFRLMSDPNINEGFLTTQEEIEAKPGKTVEIIHGQMKGMNGTLIRTKNKYFLLKVICGVGVMVHISRWYCKVLDT
jgi:transcription antitermination factor NusG